MPYLFITDYFSPGRGLFFLYNKEGGILFLVQFGEKVTCSDMVWILQITGVFIVYTVCFSLRGSEIASRKLRCFETVCRQQDKSKLQCVFPFIFS